jgi:curved DNA-binding protein CbpA
MSVPDPYKVLQVDPEAEPEVIEAAYRRLARKYHPDVSPGPESQERMVRINQAWEMLKEPGRRAAVDRARARAQAAAATAAASEARAHPAPTTAAQAASADPPRSTLRERMATGPEPGWPASAVDPIHMGAGSPSAAGARNWAPGRSTTGSGYDAASMGSSESAGPPPGKPSGTVLSFGRYAGWSLGEISRTDLEYLEWLDRMPIGRAYQAEIDTLLRARGRRRADAPEASAQRGLFRGR